VTVFDWIGAAALWGLASGVLGVVVHLGWGFHEEIGVLTGFSSFFAGIGLARWRWLRRPAETDEPTVPRVGLSTGEMTAQRLADMEARIYELEERLDLAERLLAGAADRRAVARHREETRA